MDSSRVEIQITIDGQSGSIQTNPYIGINSLILEKDAIVVAIDQARKAVGAELYAAWYPVG